MEEVQQEIGIAREVAENQEILGKFAALQDKVGMFIGNIQIYDEQRRNNDYKQLRDDIISLTKTVDLFFNKLDKNNSINAENQQLLATMMFDITNLRGEIGRFYSEIIQSMQFINEVNNIQQGSSILPPINMTNTEIYNAQMTCIYQNIPQNLQYNSDIALQHVESEWVILARNKKPKNIDTYIG